LQKQQIAYLHIPTKALMMALLAAVGARQATFRLALEMETWQALQSLDR
jgi:hypothetical protein